MKLKDNPKKYEDDPPNILLYGDIGVGKTALCLTLGDGVHYVDYEDGLRTAYMLDDKWKPDRLEADFVQFLDKQPNKKATAWHNGKQHIIQLSNQYVQGVRPFSAIVIDSLTSFAEAAMRSILYNSKRLGQAPQIQDWGAAFIEIKNTISILRGIPVPFIMVAHEMIKTDTIKAAQSDSAKASHERLQIAIEGKNLPAQISRYFDEIWYMKATPGGGNVKRRSIVTVGDNIIPARSRSDIPNETKTSVGMWELIKMTGFKPKVKEAATVST